MESRHVGLFRLRDSADISIFCLQSSLTNCNSHQVPANARDEILEALNNADDLPFSSFTETVGNY